MALEALSSTDIRKKSVPLQVADRIKAALRDGELHIGDKLPSESELADMMGVGHSSIREGIKILVAYGLLEVRQGEGTFVVDQFVENMFDFLGLDPKRDHFQGILEIRQVFERGAVNLICGRLTKEQCEHLTELAKAIRPENSLEENVFYDRAFHEQIIDYTNNTYFIEFYKMIRKMSVSLMELLMCHDDVVNDAIISHNAIAEALSNSNRVEADKQANKHLENVIKYSEMYV